jgi:hypothetical protein
MAPSIHSFARTLPFARERYSETVAGAIHLAERRLKFRYPIDLRVGFRYFSQGTRLSGAGRAVDIGSGGILVESKHRVIEGAIIEMSVEWPALLDGRIPLQLVAVGRVLRHGTSHFAAAFERHEFRTMKISSPQP